jgi:hypothetical protein
LVKHRDYIHLVEVDRQMNNSLEMDKWLLCMCTKDLCASHELKTANQVFSNNIITTKDADAANKRLAEHD